MKNKPVQVSLVIIGLTVLLLEVIVYTIAPTGTLALYSHIFQEDTSLMANIQVHAPLTFNVNKFLWTEVRALDIRWTLQQSVGSAVPAQQVQWLSIPPTFFGAQPYKGVYLITEEKYNMSIVINIPQIPSGGVSTFTVTLTNLAQPISNVTPFFRFENDYTGITLQTKTEIFSHSLTLNASPGTLKLGIQFKIPNSSISEIVYYAGTYTRFSYPKNVTILTVSWGNINEGQLQYIIIDPTIYNYMQLVSELSSKPLPSIYTNVVSNMNKTATMMASKGLYEQANQILNSLINSSYPPPPSPIFTYIFIILTIAGFAIAGVFFMFYLRIKGKVEDMHLSIRKAVEELTVLNVNLGKYDKVLVQKVQNLIEELKGVG
jgi:hypothetical protein